jgi:DNA-binding MarR family transcriptional regulator
MSRPVNTAVLMYVAHRHAERRILTHLAASGFDDLTPAQARVAARLDEDGIRLTALAERVGVTKQTAGVLVEQLERAGYVDRVPDPADARARLIRIAPRGRAAQSSARTMERTVEREWERHLGRDRMQALREALADLRQVTDPDA